MNLVRGLVRDWGSVAAWCAVVGSIAALLASLPAAAQDAPAFTVGRQYIFAWDCIPDWAAGAASQAMAGGAPLTPCYVEVLEIRTVWKNGRLTVRAQDGAAWTINPERAIGYQAVPVDREAAR